MRRFRKKTLKHGFIIPSKEEDDDKAKEDNRSNDKFKAMFP